MSMGDKIYPTYRTGILATALSLIFSWVQLGSKLPGATRWVSGSCPFIFYVCTTPDNQDFQHLNSMFYIMRWLICPAILPSHQPAKIGVSENRVLFATLLLTTHNAWLCTLPTVSSL